jgi:peroxiredoxin
MQTTLISIILAALLIPCSPGQARAAYLSGFFKNSTPGDEVQVVVSHQYIDGKTDTYSTKIISDLSFSLDVQLPEPQVAILKLGEDRMYIFLEPNDTFEIQADVFRFPVKVMVGGKGGPNNAFLQEYLRIFPFDFNEFNNLRFKVGQYWPHVEEPDNKLMEDLGPELYKSLQDSLKAKAFGILDAFESEQPNALTPVFKEWLSTEIIYTWAYKLLFYGQVYGGRHFVQPEFFDFLYEAPVVSNMVGSETYRHFLMLLIARQQAKKNEPSDKFFSGAYKIAGEILEGKSLAFTRSEFIIMGFYGERYRELLPCYNDFLQKNTFGAYDEKVQYLYTRMSKHAPGSLAPQFEGRDETNTILNLSALKGNLVYLNFWASWCAACRRKMEIFDGFYEELQRRGIFVVNISIDQDTEKWKAALTEQQFKGFNLLSSTGKAGDIGKQYDVEAVPQYFIIGKNGTFVDKAFGNQPFDIKNHLLELSKQGY